ncbi:MAG: PCMD domain-containing protein [Bacteroidales bacterium]|nr:PCMD domain-containing protein [Bacteroidales bacterium]
MRRIVSYLIMGIATICSYAEEPAGTAELIKYGDFNSWVTRQIHESKIIGGEQKTVYAIGPTRTIEGSDPYHNLGGSPWGSSNVLAKVAGVTKTSNAVYPDDHPGHGKCAKLTTEFEHCKVMGLVNMEVMVAGSIFLGEMVEPIKSTKNPYSKMIMGIPFTRRPKALQFDYKLEMPQNAERVYSSGFGKKKTYPGHDESEALIILQRRWEDADGNVYAKRVGTGRMRFSKSTDWVENYQVPVMYGDITKSPNFKEEMDLIPKDRSYYTRNSHGKLVPVIETGWDDADATPTHLFVMFSAGSGEAYVGTPGLTFWVDDVALVY